jgi:hypothetical protein
MSTARRTRKSSNSGSDISNDSAGSEPLSGTPKSENPPKKRSGETDTVVASSRSRRRHTSASASEAPPCVFCLPSYFVPTFHTNFRIPFHWPIDGNLPKFHPLLHLPRLHFGRFLNACFKNVIFPCRRGSSSPMGNRDVKSTLMENSIALIQLRFAGSTKSIKLGFAPTLV